MHMKVLVSVLSLVLCSSSLLGQEKNNNWNRFPTSTDSVQSKAQVKTAVIIDSVPAVKAKPGSAVSNINTQIQEVNNLYIEQSKVNPTISGFTILVYSGSGANSKLKARNNLIAFENLYPDHTTHLAWKSPNYELRVGDFRTKLEAEKLLITIHPDFPAAFVKVAMIDLPLLENEK